MKKKHTEAQQKAQSSERARVVSRNISFAKIISQCMYVYSCEKPKQQQQQQRIGDSIKYLRVAQLQKMI